MSGTFPGWPASQQPSVLHFLLVVLGIPVAIAAVVAVLALAGRLSRASHGGAVHMKEPLWVGETSARKALTADTKTTETGGASVRW